MSEQFHAPRPVFVDTSAFLAIAFDRDANYRVARRVQQSLSDGGLLLVTTYFVLAELHALAITRVGPKFALNLLRQVEDGDTVIVHTRDEDWLAARRILERYRDKDFSMTDALSFAVMERQKISLAFTFDRHFAQSGCQIVDDYFR